MHSDKKAQNHIWYGKSILFQIFLILGVFCVFYDVAYLSPLTAKDNLRSIQLGIGAINLIELAVLIFWLVKYRHELFADLKNIWKQNFEILFFAIFYGITCLSIVNDWLSGDGYDYYNSLVGLRWNAFGNLFHLKLCTHETGPTTMWYLIGEYLRPDYAVGVRCIMILIAVLTVASFYGILRNIFPERDRFSVLLVTAILAYNPLIFGILAEFNIDFFVLCAFVWMLYFHCKKKYILMAYAGLLMCFSKENGVVIYAAYLAGWIIWQLIRDIRERKGHVTDGILPFLGCVVPGLIWYWRLRAGGGETWSGGTSGDVTTAAAVPTGSNMAYMNAFNVWPSYIVHQIKEMLFVNYGWVYVLIFVVLILCLIICRKRLTFPEVEGGMVLGFILSMLAFFGFSLLYVTWTNYRYLSMLAVLEGVFAALLLLGVIPQIKARTVVAGGLLALTLNANFNMDILSAKFLPTDNLGNGSMANCSFQRMDGDLAVVDEVSEQFTGYGDLGITNREYNYRQKVLDQVLKEIDYDENTALIMPISADENRHMIYGRHANWLPDVMYVDREDLTISLNGVGIDYASMPDLYMPLNAFYPMDPNAKMKQENYDKYDRIYYVFFPFGESYDTSIFLNDYEIIDQFEVVKNHTKCLVYEIK